MADSEFFPTANAFRAWLVANHNAASECIVGFYKAGSGQKGITLAEAQEQALCFGWIDGVLTPIDGSSYGIRFTPRRKGSTWSNVNIKRVESLTERGLMTPAGLAAFNARTAERSGTYSFEREDQPFPPEFEAAFRAEPPVWEWFTARPPSYQRAARFWVLSARRAETRQKRLETLIADSAAGRNIKPLTFRPARKD